MVSLPWADDRKLGEWLPGSAEAPEDADRVLALMSLFAGSTSLSQDEERLLRTHWDMPNRIPLPKSGRELLAQITHQIVDVLNPDVLAAMVKDHVRSTRNTMRSLFMLPQMGDIKVEGLAEGWEECLGAIGQIPADRLVTDKAFLHKIAQRQESDSVNIGDLFKLGLVGLVVVSGTEDYVQVNRLRHDLAIVGIDIPMSRHHHVGQQVLEKNQIRGQYGLIYEENLRLERLFVEMDGSVSDQDKCILSKLSEQQVTELGQLITLTAKDLLRFKLSWAERARVIVVMALDGVVLKDALPDPFEPKKKSN